jgi:hypothetical protein
MNPFSCRTKILYIINVNVIFKNVFVLNLVIAFRMFVFVLNLVIAF